MIIRTLPILFLLILAGCTVWNEKPAASTGWAMATSGEQLERLLWQDIQAKNWKSVDEHIGSKFASVSPTGIHNHNDAMAVFQQLDIRSFSIGDVDSRLNGDDLVVTYTITLEGTRAGQPIQVHPAHMMTVWQRVKKGWVMIAHANVPRSAS